MGLYILATMFSSLVVGGFLGWYITFGCLESRIDDARNDVRNEAADAGYAEYRLDRETGKIEFVWLDPPKTEN